MRYAKTAVIVGVVAVAFAAAFFYHQSGMKQKDIESLKVENQIGNAVIEQQVKNHVANEKAAQQYDSRAQQIESAKAKAKHDLEELFEDAANHNDVDDDRLTDVLLNYQNSLRSSTAK